MIETLDQWDKALFRVMNSWHSPFWDPVMETLSSRVAWIPVYLFIVIVLWRQRGWKDLLLIGILTGVAVVLADQIASGMLKPWIARWRPCHPEAGLDFAVHIVNGHCGGKYSFASSHAANFFTMATIFAYRFRSWRPAPGVAFAVAALAAYSRIYLGVHYPGDILAGLIIGLLCGGAACWGYRTLCQRWQLSGRQGY